MGYRCANCGELHETDEVAFGFEVPDQWDAVGDERDPDSEYTEDQCVLYIPEGTAFFMRCVLEIPVRAEGASIQFTVWGSLSETSFDEMHEAWENPRRVELGPYFSYLSNRIPGFPPTMFLPGSYVVVGGNNASTTYSGNLTDEFLALRKEGTGTWTLAESNLISEFTVGNGAVVFDGAGGTVNVLQSTNQPVTFQNGADFSVVNLSGSSPSSMKAHSP
jgi:hypothetical protein